MAAAASLRLTGAAPAPDSSTAAGEFITFTATMRLPIAPRFAAGNHSSAYPGHGHDQQHDDDGGLDGVREVLAGWVMRYLPPLRAVLLAFDPHPRFLHPAAPFPASASPFDSSYVPAGPDGETADGDPAAGSETVRFKSLPMIQGTGFTLAQVEWQGVGWRPRIGMKLLGTLTLASPSHVSLLLHNLFNASIPSSHLPSDEWEFDPDYPVPPIVLERRNAGVPLPKAVDDLAASATGATAEVGEALTAEEEEKDGEIELAAVEAAAEEDAAAHAERGWWIHRTSREPLGGADGRIEFTLVDLTTTNSLLSCTGSLLADPFSPTALAALTSAASTHPAPNTTTTQKLKNQRKRARRDNESDAGESDSEASSASPGPGDDDSDDDSSSSEVDNDDDDGVGTGIPRHGGAASVSKRGGVAVVPEVITRRPSPPASVASSRSPSPLPPPRTVKEKDVERSGGDDAKKAKKEKKKEEKKKKADGEAHDSGRKTKKVKAER